MLPCTPTLGAAVSHMELVYQLIGGGPDTIPTHKYVWPSQYSGNDLVRVVKVTTYYHLVVEYYPEGTYTCYGVVDLTWTIMAVHDIYGLGNLLSIVQMVEDYCNEYAPGYAQCRTCRYASYEAKYAWCKDWYCGQGLEIDTGTCNSWVGGTPGE